MSRGTAVQLKGMNGLAARPEARWTARASTSLPVPVSPATRTVMSAGGLRRGAVLLVTPVAVEGDRRVDELADGDAGAAVVEGGPKVGDDFPGLVAVEPADDAEPLVGLLRSGHRLGLRPAAGRDAAKT